MAADAKANLSPRGNVALDLARQGFKVFPITAGAKAPPLVSAWQKFATTEPGTLRAWWTQWPDANIGIHTEGLLVVDVDTKKNGPDSLDKFEAAHGELPATLAAETATGGKHLIYAAEGVGNGVDVFGPGVDVRGVGGYIVAAGSIVKGKPYRFLNPGHPITPAPACLIERAPKAGERKTRERSDAPAVATDTELAEQRARDFLHTHPVAIEGRGGDAHTYATAARIREFGVPEQRAADCMAEWNARCSPPWEPDALAEKITNAYRYAQESAGKLTPEALGFEAISQPVQEQAIASAASKPAKRRTLRPGEIELASTLETRYLVKGWLHAQSLAMVFGKQNAGKTFIALSLAAHVAAGADWFGRRVHQAGVLAFVYEGDIALGRRLVALRRKHPEFNWAGLPFLVELMSSPLIGGSGAGRAQFDEALHSFRREFNNYPGLIIIDTLRSALGGSDSDPALTEQYLMLARQVRQETGATVLTVHHPGHGDTDRSRGDSGLEAAMDTVLRVDGERWEIGARKQRDEARGVLPYALEIVELGRDHEGDPVTTCVAIPGAEQPEGAMLAPVQRALYKAAEAVCGPDRTFQRREAVARSGLPKNSADKAWKALLAKGVIEPAKLGLFRVLERGPEAIFDSN